MKCKHPGCDRDVQYSGAGRPPNFCGAHSTSRVYQPSVQNVSGEAWIEVTVDENGAPMVDLVTHKRWGMIISLYHDDGKFAFQEALDATQRWSGALQCAVDDMTPFGLEQHIKRQRRAEKRRRTSGQDRWLFRSV